MQQLLGQHVLKSVFRPHAHATKPDGTGAIPPEARTPFPRLGSNSQKTRTRRTGGSRPAPVSKLRPPCRGRQKAVGRDDGAGRPRSRAAPVEAHRGHQTPRAAPIPTYFRWTGSSLPEIGIVDVVGNCSGNRADRAHAGPCEFRQFLDAPRSAPTPPRRGRMEPPSESRAADRGRCALPVSRSPSRPARSTEQRDDGGGVACRGCRCSSGPRRARPVEQLERGWFQWLRVTGSWGRVPVIAARFPRHPHAMRNADAEMRSCFRFSGFMALRLMTSTRNGAVTDSAPLEAPLRPSRPRTQQQLQQDVPSGVLLHVLHAEELLSSTYVLVQPGGEEERETRSPPTHANVVGRHAPLDVSIASARTEPELASRQVLG